MNRKAFSDDFRLWFDSSRDYITPLLESTYQVDGHKAILLSGNTNDSGEWGPAIAVGEKSLGKGSIVICQLKLSDRILHNPAAKKFAVRLLGCK